MVAQPVVAGAVALRTQCLPKSQQWQGTRRGPSAQRAPILHRLGHVRLLHGFGGRQVGNGARHLQGAVRAACRPAQPRGGGVQEAERGGLQRRMAVDRRARQRLVRRALAGDGAFAGRDDACTDVGGRFARRGVEQLPRRDRRHLHVQVDAVEQRAAELALVAGHLVGRAAAGLEGGAEVAAGARVHGRDELEARGELGPARGARDGDRAGLQWLAQGFEGGAGELGELIQKKNPLVRQRNLARPWRRSAGQPYAI